MARISYDDQTAAAFKAVREVPRDGLSEWREAVRRHLRPSPGMTVADIGAGTGSFAAAFSDWFGLSVVAVEPSAAMRDQIPRTPAILADFLGQVDAFRLADTTMRNLTEDEFLRGKERLRRAVRHAGDPANPETRSNWLDLLVLR